MVTPDDAATNPLLDTVIPLVSDVQVNAEGLHVAGGWYDPDLSGASSKTS